MPYEFHVPANPKAVSKARRRVAAVVRRWHLLSDDTLADLDLLTSEVITNAIVHTETECTVRVCWTGQRVRVEVTDTSSRGPNMVIADDQDESGRGLLLVSTLAAAWGTTPTPGGKTVWFTCGAFDGTASQNTGDGSLPAARELTRHVSRA